jgi:phosphoribosylcarboxyaminoimidazole (NCAIR) mutase
MKKGAKVSIIMGSDSDLGVMSFFAEKIAPLSYTGLASKLAGK